jgi:hypothetical protein
MMLVYANVLIPTLFFRVRDWLYGIRNDEPTSNSNEPQTEAERLRVINQMITLPKEEGGAAITPNHGEWKNVTAIFPLHDIETNKKWIRAWSSKTFLSDDDLDQIRNKFGESVCVGSGCYSSAWLT